MSTIKEPAFAQLTDLASVSFGGSILFATDEWFAVAANLIEPADAVFDPDAFTEFGKLMDGWETRRKRIPGHDWCVVKLALPGSIVGIEIDTAHFTGNFVPAASVQGACLEEDPAFACATLGQMGTCATPEECAAAAALGSDAWETLVPETRLASGAPETRRTFVRLSPEHAAATKRWTHVRLNMFPDGGIARLRVYGMPAPRVAAPGGGGGGGGAGGAAMDLLAAQNGGQAVACSNQHYGTPRNLLQPGRGINMGAGWETARHPDRPRVLRVGADGMMLDLKSDWSLLQLCGAGGSIAALEVDTNHFRGNFPESCLVEACTSTSIRAGDEPEPGAPPPGEGEEWKVLLPRSKLGASAVHAFSVADGTLENVGGATHVRVTIFPDGGIMRLRAFGTPTPF
jgi:allantoicase